MTSLPPTARAWLQLVRPPNLFTVPGDPLAGFVAACVAAGCAPDLRLVVLPALASLLLYVGGLIGNDVADEAEDRRDRPSRPIPSGRVSRRAAFLAAAACALAALLLSLVAGWQVFVAAAFTQLAIMAYNGGLKRHAVIGSLAMGACRGGSVLIGAAASGALLGRAPLLLAVGVTLYIAAITWIADRETESIRLGFRRWLPLVVLISLLGLAGGWLRQVQVAALVAGVAAVAWSAYQAWLLRGTPPPPVVGRSVGALIRGLLLVQAAFCALGGVSGLAVAVALLLLWPVSARVGKWFYAS